MNESLEHRRRRLLYRSRYTGMKEMDTLLGRFADRYLGGLDAGQLDRYDLLLSAGDAVLLSWILGRTMPPPEHDHDVLKLIIGIKNARL